MRNPYLWAAAFGLVVTLLTGCSGLTVKATYQYPPAEDRN